MEKSNKIWEIIEDNNLLESIEINGNNKSIVLEISQDTDDGTYNTVEDYIKLVNKIESYGIIEYFNHFFGDDILEIKMFGYKIIRKNKLSNKVNIIFDEPIEVYFENVGELEITSKVSEIEGELFHEFYWNKNSKQNKVANIFEILFNIEKYVR